MTLTDDFDYQKKSLTPRNTFVKCESCITYHSKKIRGEFEKCD